jgi:putative membrane protein
MKRFMFHLIAVTLAVAAAAKLIPGVVVGSWFSALFAALAIGFVNAIVRPLLRLLTFPLTVVTLGFFYLVLNGICFALAAALVPGFSVDNLGAAFMGSVVVWAVSTMIGWFGPDEDPED